MKPIATWSFEPWNSKNNAWADTQLMLASMYNALKSIHKATGIAPTVYTDQLGASIFSEIYPQANIEVLFNSIFSDVNTEFWAYPKLLTYSYQSEPFVHFDLDLEITSSPVPLLKEYSAGFAFYELPHERNYITADQGYSVPEYFYEYPLTNLVIPNMSIFSCTDLGFCSEYSAESIRYFKSNSVKDTLSSKLLKNNILEQQILAVMLLKYRKNYTYLAHSCDRVPGCILMPAQEKNTLDTILRLRPFVTEKIKELATYLHSIK
jgi:hypothetical protein